VASPRESFDFNSQTPLPLRGISPERGEKFCIKLNLNYFQKFLPLPGEVPEGRWGLSVMQKSQGKCPKGDGVIW